MDAGRAASPFRKVTQTETGVNCNTLDCAPAKYVTGMIQRCRFNTTTNWDDSPYHGQIDFGNENQVGFDEKKIKIVKSGHHEQEPFASPLTQAKQKSGKMMNKSLQCFTSIYNAP